MFKGAMTALVTPFRGGKVDYDALGALVEDQIARGINGLVPCGTTGESPTLSEKEHEEIIAFVVKTAKKRVPVIAGTGSNSTQETLHYTRFALEAGADAALLVCPYYNKPSQRGLLAHFRKVADEVGLPQILYNIQGRTGINMAPETIAELSAHPRIVGVKEASGNLEQMARIRQLCPPDFSLLSGDDTLTLPILSVGGSGVISVISNLLPGETSGMVRSYLEGHVKDAQAAFAKHFSLTKTVMGTDANPVGIKAALAMKGVVTEEYRLPLVPPTDEARAVLKREMTAVGLL